MPIVGEPEKLAIPVLRALVARLSEDLHETLDLVERPAAAVRDPASLETAADLIRATLAIIGREDPQDAVKLGADANLAYASLLAAIDLLKSHTELPRVPVRRGASTSAG